MEWKFANPASGSKLAVLDALQNVPDDFEIGRGVPRAAGFPDDARIPMARRFPKQLALGDSYGNVGDLWVASMRLAELVKAHTPRDLELLPLTIIDHKGRAVETPHVIIHPTRVVDAIDQARSKYELNRIDPTFISSADVLVLDPTKFPLDVGVCRVRLINDRVLVSPALVAAIDAAGMTGVRWMSAADFRW